MWAFFRPQKEVTMYPTCASCTVQACAKGTTEGMPKNCPMRDPGFFEQTFPEYQKAENHDFYVTASEIEGLGYGEWCRLKETLELCKAMRYQRIGIAFCQGLSREARIISRIFVRHGFEVASVICKTGGIEKEQVGIARERKVNPEAAEMMCNPISQAKLLNLHGTQFNVLVGLCVGHDSMFYKYSDALVTTLIAKDRVLAHNPAGAVYCSEGYYKKKLGL